MPLTSIFMEDPVGFEPKTEAPGTAGTSKNSRELKGSR